MTDIASLTTKDGRFSYEAAGKPDLPALVFLHGIGGAARGWRNQLQFFSDRYYAIAWDMPGYGGSAALPSVSIAALADALNDFLKATGASKPVIVGHSIGGMIAQQVLAKHPDIASAVVLAQTSPAFGKAGGEWQQSFVETRLGPLDRGETMASLAPKLVKELIGDNPDPAGIALARECMAAVPPETYRAMIHSMIGFDLRGALKEISVPALLLSGSKDNNSPAAMVKKTATFISGSTFVELEGVGHLANLERPGEFNDAVADFLFRSHDVSGSES